MKNQGKSIQFITISCVSGRVKKTGEKAERKNLLRKGEKENAHGFEMMQIHVKSERAAFLFRIPDSHDDPLREIAEFFAEQVDAADVRRVRVNTDAQGDVFQRVELQIRDGDA